MVTSTPPRISVIVLNYNGAAWIEKCIRSVFAQSNREDLELIIADNNSSDESPQVIERLVAGQSRARFIQHGQNLGFCEGNNRAAAHATGRFLFFLNNDAWLEEDCLQILYSEMQRVGASVATPYVMNWGDNNYQWVYAAGFDMFGLPSFRMPPANTTRLFMPPGCSYCIDRELFDRLGRFDPEFFMYADELDLSWRVWISGNEALIVPNALLHHRGAADVNPAGGGQIVEYRTSESKRYYTNRNCLLVLLMNAQHLLLLLVPLQLALLMAEGLVALILIRRISFVRRSYFEAVRDVFRMRDYICSQRARNRSFRTRGDFWMLRFLRFRLNRWDELKQTFKMGIPKVAAR